MKITTRAPLSTPMGTCRQPNANIDRANIRKQSQKRASIDTVSIESREIAVIFHTGSVFFPTPSAFFPTPPILFRYTFTTQSRGLESLTLICPRYSGRQRNRWYIETVFTLATKGAS